MLNKPFEEKLLDSEQIDMLIETGGEEAAELLQELVDLYESECSVKMAELQVAVSTGDFHVLGRCAHAIAGSSANIGALEMWRFSKEIEAKACKASEQMISEATITAYQVIYSNTLQALRDIIAGVR